LLCAHPGVVGETAADLDFALCLDDQEHADAAVLAAGERTAEEDETLVCERVHERRVLVHGRLVEDASCGPSGPGLAFDGEGGHARATRNLYSFERR
jgi:hypothetical protein